MTNSFDSLEDIRGDGQMFGKCWRYNITRCLSNGWINDITGLSDRESSIPFGRQETIHAVEG